MKILSMLAHGTLARATIVIAIGQGEATVRREQLTTWRLSIKLKFAHQADKQAGRHCALSLPYARPLSHPLNCFSIPICHSIFAMKGN